MKRIFFATVLAGTSLLLGCAPTQSASRAATTYACTFPKSSNIDSIVYGNGYSTSASVYVHRKGKAIGESYSFGVLNTGQLPDGTPVSCTKVQDIRF